ncbi:hypothetical protein THRCLA_09535, partial [Thraustotheca clavata]
MAVRFLGAWGLVLCGIEATELVLWPSDTLGTLSVTENTLDSSSSHTLGVVDTIFSIEQKGTWHEAIESVEVAIVPSVDSGNVWTQILAQEEKMETNAEGIHVRVHVKESTSALEIQGNITLFLNQVFGTSFSSKTYLFANASCDVLKYAIAKENKIARCFLSSREITSLPTLKIPTFFQNQDDTPLQRALALQLTKHTVNAGQWELLYTQLIFSPRQSKISVAFHQVAQTKDKVTFSSEVGVVESIDENGNIKSSSITRKIKVNSPKITNVKPQIIGNGFHQTMNIQFKLNTNEECSLLVVQPFPTTAYADMDELRRLERFGSFQLIGFSKHIEIERPAAISTEHVVAFLKKLPGSGAGAHTFDFPIHFRYQSPSKDVLYRPANVIAPSMFIQCGLKFSSDAKDWT